MPNEKPINSGLIAALTGKLRQTADIWFGPSAPPPQVAPATNPVRSFDYPVGVNVQFAPRSDEPVTFEQMRNLGDEYYLLRIVIETVKDRICAKPWQFRVKGSGTAQRLKPSNNSIQRTAEAVLFYGGINSTASTGSRPGESAPQKHWVHNDLPLEQRIERLTQFFRMPDREHTWQKWLRALLEDLLVIDAATLYPQRTKGGEIFRLAVIDGATIKRVIDPMGFTPEPPAVAYQQVIKGVLAKDLTR